MDQNKTVTVVLDKISESDLNSNLDTVLKDVKKSDDTCDYKTCKQKTNLMGQNCSFCSKRYCYKHGLPEAHTSQTNCAELVKKKEREEFLHPKIDTRKSAAKKDHAKAQNTLTNKLKQMQLERKAKPSGIKSDKKK
ncbi:unnamed protein product [Diamesa serratosioi]